MAQLGDAAKTGIKDAVREFVVNSFLLGSVSQALNDEDSFLEKGIIDSTGILELVSFVQDEFGIKIDDAELVPDNLDSLNNLETFIIRKKQEQSDASL